jgi:N-acetyldiaminopimelate deacetylase
MTLFAFNFLFSGLVCPMKASDFIMKMQPWLTQIRRELHKIPEICYKEFKTAQLIRSTLDELGLTYKTVKTGTVVHIDGFAPTRTVGFRADIDALRLTEEADIDFKSTHIGYMHACGHDCHAAMLLGLAKYLVANPPRDNVVLVWQPAEEGGNGAQMMIDSGLIDADVYYALHVKPELPVGSFATASGALMAGSQRFVITFRGLSRHAKDHDGTQDAIIAAADFIMEAESLNEKGNLVYHVGTINGGTAVNIVADEVTIDATMRFFNTAVMENAVATLMQIARKMESKNRGQVTVKLRDDTYFPTINTREVAERIKSLDGFVEAEKSWGAEDFSLFTEHYTGAMTWLGAMPSNGTVYPIHNNNVTFNEDALAVGVQFFVSVLG